MLYINQERKARHSSFPLKHYHRRSVFTDFSSHTPYDGNSHTISITGVKTGSTINYRTTANGTWTTVKPSRKAVGKVTVYFQITNNNYKTVTGYRTVVINPGKTTISSLTSAAGSFTLNWEKNTVQTTGYQIQYSTSSTFASGNKTATITSNTTTSKTIKNLSSNTRYYVRVRTYKLVGETKYYSEWSAKKSVVIK